MLGDCRNRPFEVAPEIAHVVTMAPINRKLQEYLAS